MDDEGFTTAQASQVLGLPRTTLDAWLLRGYLGIPAPGAGRNRLLSLRELVQFGIMKAAAEFGIPPAQSAPLAMGAAIRAQTTEVTTMRVAFHPEGMETTFNGEPAKDPLPSSPMMALEINVATITEYIRVCLEEGVMLMPGAPLIPIEPARKRGRRKKVAARPSPPRKKGR